MKICIWQYRPSLHQLALIKALNKKCELTWVLEKNDLDSNRLKMGWSSSCQVPNILLENYMDMIEFIDEIDSSYIHVFGGLRSSVNLFRLIKFLAKNNKRIFIQSESPNYFGFMGKFRLIRGYFDKVVVLNKIEGIFAIGSTGVNYFHKIKFPQNKIFEWAYFVERGQVHEKKTISNKFQIIFVGRLILTKGVDVLINCLSKINLDYQLTIIGNGPEENYLKNKVKMNPLIKNNIEFVNFVSNDKVKRYISKSDLLILPSVSKDGWGAVVSESLMLGTPVITSDRCGSSVLLSNSMRGLVVKAGSLKSLKCALKNQILKGKVSEDIRNEIISWSECLEGDVGAQYMIDCINGKNRKAPWLN